jgi:hypothetical protein
MVCLNNNLSIEDAIKDFIELKSIDLTTTSPLSQKGLKFINFFTLIERLDTKGIKKLSFFEFIDNSKSNLLHQDECSYLSLRNALVNSEDDYLSSCLAVTMTKLTVKAKKNLSMTYK